MQFRLEVLHLQFRLEVHIHLIDKKKSLSWSSYQQEISPSTSFYQEKSPPRSSYQQERSPSRSSYQQEKSPSRSSYEQEKKEESPSRSSYQQEKSPTYNSITISELKDVVCHIDQVYQAVKILMLKLFPEDYITNHSVSGKASNSKTVATPQFDARLYGTMLSVLKEKFPDVSTKQITEKVHSVQKFLMVKNKN